MKSKPFARSGVVLLYLCVIIGSVFTTSCAGGDKKQEAPAEKKDEKKTVYGNDWKADGNGDTISLHAADTMIYTYDQNILPLLNGRFRGDTSILPKTETFSTGIIQSLINQDGATGLRIYMCMDTTSKKIKVILVATDKEGRDIIMNSGGGTGRSAGSPAPPMIVEDGTRQP